MTVGVFADDVRSVIACVYQSADNGVIGTSRGGESVAHGTSKILHGEDGGVVDGDT